MLDTLTRTLLMAGCWLAFALACQGAHAANTAGERQVLVLYSLGSESTSVWQRLVHKGLYDELGKRSWGATPAIYEERFDANRVGEEQARESMAPYLRSKYAKVPLDAIVAENHVASEFLGEHPELFPGVPRFYVNHGRLGWQPADGTGIEVTSDFDRAIGIVPRVAPQVRRLVVIGDRTPRAQAWIAAIRAISGRHADKLKIEYRDDRSFEQLERMVATLGRDSAVFLLSTVTDSNGDRLSPPAFARRIAAASAVPVFTHMESLVLPGVAGGYVISAESIGRVIARILLGQRTDGIDVQGYFFDDPTVRRFGLRDVPADAVLLNRPDNVWELYRWQIIAGVTLIVLEGVLISALVAALRDRRRMLADLNAERNNLEDRVLQRTLELLMANTKLEQLATTDPLTGIANRRKMTEQIGAELERARRFGHPLSLLMVDIDHFKRINDTYGHEVGDQAIVATSKLLTESLRAIDLAARFGGEEFVVLMPETEEFVAAVAAERLRDAAGTLRVRAEDGTEVALTISIGVTSVLAADTPSTLLMRADKALYRAKREGRNRVVRF
jgi:diguanylate cyclase (GGDEF)-like protein